MDDMKERVNNRLRKLSIPNFAKFVAKFKQEHTDIAEFKRQPPPSAFDPPLVVSDKAKDLIDFMGKPLKDKGKKIDESSNTKSKRKKWHMDDALEYRAKRKALKTSKREREEKEESYW